MPHSLHGPWQIGYARPAKRLGMAATETIRPAADSAPELRRRWFAEAARDSQLTRFLLLRGIGFIYVVAYSILVQQGLPLLGSRGLMPAAAFLQRVRQANASSWHAWLEVPTLFWWNSSD